MGGLLRVSHTLIAGIGRGLAETAREVFAFSEMTLMKAAVLLSRTTISEKPIKQGFLIADTYL